MSNSTPDVDSYLRRIGFTGTARVDEATLRSLHRLHLRTVPFEAIDNQLGQTVSLDDAWIFDKIVNRRRGGSCYELNILFAWLLRALGFRVDLLGGRMIESNGAQTEDCDHMCLLVEAGGRFIADVGFIHLFQEPMLLQSGAEHLEGARKFRMLEEWRIWNVERWDGKEWYREYNFTLQPRQATDFQARLIHHQTSALSPFVRHRIVALESATGMRLLWDFDLRTLVDATGLWEKTTLKDEAEYRTALRTHFGLEVQGEFAPLRSPAGAETE